MVKKGANMKGFVILSQTALLSLLVGCSTTTVAVSTVGPNPNGEQNLAQNNGRLQVFSVLVSHAEGNNPTWYRHADYDLYTANGVHLQHVDNATGHYERAPRLVVLPPGKYVVEAAAQKYLRMEVPVVIEAGRVTRVHLDGAWRQVAGTPNAEVVCGPDGRPVGWRVVTNTPG
jgi:hypothetical protein